MESTDGPSMLLVSKGTNPPPTTILSVRMKTRATDTGRISAHSASIRIALAVMRV